MRKLRFTNGEIKEAIERICHRIEKHEIEIYAQVLATDMKLINAELEKEVVEEWQELFKEILVADVENH